MERDLCEETGIRPRDIRSTKVIGFARWPDRGARPEFFGVTKLWITAKDVAERERNVSWAEHKYTSGTQTRSVDF
jgi:hypothetical protein